MVSICSTSTTDKLAMMAALHKIMHNYQQFYEGNSQLTAAILHSLAEGIPKALEQLSSTPSTVSTSPMVNK